MLVTIFQIYYSMIFLVLNVLLIGERAKRARHYQGFTNSSWCGTCMYGGGTYHNGSACHVYVMWAELAHGHFLYVPAVSNVVTNGNGTGTKNVLKGTVRFGLSLVSSLLSSRRYYCSDSKTILYLDTVNCKFLLYVSIEINPVF